MKKFLSFSLALLLLLACIPFSGCYRIRAVSRRDIAGTYQLTSLRRTDKPDDPEGDLLTLNEITEYLIVDENGGGYLIYSDKNTPLTCRNIETRLIASEEDANKYEYVEFRPDTQTNWEKYGYSHRGLNKRVVGGMTKLHIDYYIDTEYKRLDSAQDLSYIQKKLGQTFTPLSYGLGPLQGTVSYLYPESPDVDTETLDTLPLYEIGNSVLDIDIPNKRVTHTYRLKNDSALHTETLPLTIEKTESGYTLKIGQDVYYATISVSSDSAYVSLRCEKTAGQTEEHAALRYALVYGASSKNRPAPLKGN